MEGAAPTSRGLRARVSKDFAWSFVTQVCSSGTNFGLTVVTARILGPSGVGVVYIGFVAYQLALGLQRALVTQPLVAGAAAREVEVRRRLIGYALTATVGSGVAVTLLLAVVGLVDTGDTGRGLLLFMPWVAAGLLQEYLKSVLFQENLAKAAALSDAVRLLFFVLAVPIAASDGSDVAVVAAWGVGYVPGVLVALVALRPRVERFGDSLGWLRGDAWRLGRWLAARELAYQLAVYATVLALAIVLGPGDLGGLRAAETVFSPFSFVAAAFVLPALPILSQALAGSRKGARTLAVKISAVALAGCLVYALVMFATGSWLLTTLFGSDFAPYEDLVWPYAVSQLALASSMPFGVLLTAERRGRDVFVIGLVLSSTILVLPTLLAIPWGVVGAAWGFALSMVLTSVALLLAGWVERVPWSRGTGS